MEMSDTKEEKRKTGSLQQEIIMAALPVSKVSGMCFITDRQTDQISAGRHVQNQLKY